MNSKLKKSACIFGLLAFIPWAAFASKAESLIANGNRAYEKGDFAAASKYYTEALQYDPASDSASYNLGTALAREKKFDDAGKWLDQAASNKLSPLRRDSLYNEGVAKAQSAEGEQVPIDQKMKILDEAREHLREAVKIDPSRPNAVYNYQQVLEKLKELQAQQQQGQQGEQQQGQQGQQGEQQQGQQGQQGEQQQGQQGQQGEQQQGQQGQQGEQQQGQQGQQGEQQQGQQGQQGEQQQGQQGQQGEQQQGQQGQPGPRGSEKPADGQKDQPQSNGGEDKDKKTQEQGLEQGQAGQKPDDKKDGKDGGKPDTSKTGESGAEGGKAEESQDVRNANMVLDDLADSRPDQYKKLFRFRNNSAERALDKAW